MKRLSVILFCCMFLCSGIVSAQEDLSIKQGNYVKFEYKLIVNGKIVDSSEGKKPFKYVHGNGEIIPGLEKQLEGLVLGSEKTIDVSYLDAYGPVDPKAFLEVPIELFPNDVDIRLGQVIPLKDKAGKEAPAIVTEIRKEVVLLDFNHPLAGKDLTFYVKIIDIQEL